MLALLKLLNSFLPWKVIETQPTAASVDELKVFPFLNDPNILTNLKSELSVYLATAARVTPSTVTEAVTWWKNHSNELYTTLVKFLEKGYTSSAIIGIRREGFFLVKSFLWTPAGQFASRLCTIVSYVAV